MDPQTEAILRGLTVVVWLLVIIVAVLVIIALLIARL